jgi:hypothetical protein
MLKNEIIFKLTVGHSHNTKIAAIFFCWAAKVFELRKAKNVKLATQR